MVSAVEAANFNGIGRAMVNRPLMFRRAIELIHGGSIATNVTGFTLVTENPVYMRGDWNSNTAVGFTGAHAATSVIGDAFTALSGNWSDILSFASPYSAQVKAGAGQPGRSKRTGDSYTGSPSWRAKARSFRSRPAPVPRMAPTAAPTLHPLSGGQRRRRRGYDSLQGIAGDVLLQPAGRRDLQGRRRCGVRGFQPVATLRSIQTS